MSAVTYDRAQRCLAPIFPPRRVEVAGLGEALQALAAHKLLLCPSPGGQELGQAERPRGEKWGKDWLESLYPTLGPQILALKKPQPGIPAKGRRVRRLGRNGLQAGLGSERCLPALTPHPWAASPGGCLEPRPRASSISFLFFYCYFCPIGYRSVLHPVWFSDSRMPWFSVESVGALLLKE